MGRRKLDKFRDNELSDNIIQPGKEIFEKIKGNWNQLYFRNQHPVILELGCGKGEYTVGLARLFPEKNVIGIDIKGSRIWNGSQAANNGGLDNAAFLRIQIQQLDQFFREEEVDEIWITFPDPRPRDRDERRRLTHPRFLSVYYRILKPGGWIHLKTDNAALFSYSLGILTSLDYIHNLEYTSDLYHSNLINNHHGIRTGYENRFLEEGTPIKYLRFQISKEKCS
ncbi:MAG: tRNA (guanosine(46)-N7)-methyltransferase TrmB [Cyclobacteriaceae bacterium]|nr:tRNA (guanosine(46)-N7)-methyltransferase TrmB [Cyclobacteriaceae bacterium]